MRSTLSLSLAFFQVTLPVSKVALVASPMACWMTCLSCASRFSWVARISRTACSSAKAAESDVSWLKSSVSPLSCGNRARSASSAETVPSAGGGVSVST
ncbi:hypothetical protein D3C78_1726930 [compost metagenome]